jgi:cyclic pyranopterin phosphate synthase
MVDVGEKPLTSRRAVAEGKIRLGADSWATLTQGRTPKGDVLSVARLAGLQAAKHTALLVPLCHPIPITGVSVDVTLHEGSHSVCVTASVTTVWRTGVEMEALVAVSAALLAVYDMLKAVDRSMEIGEIRLLSKEGGRTGPWERA